MWDYGLDRIVVHSRNTKLVIVRSFVSTGLTSVLTGLAIFLGGVLPSAAPAFSSDKPDIRTATSTATASKTSATYQIDVGLDGEVYPVFANYASLQKAVQRVWGTIAVTVTNSSEQPLRDRITVQVPGWSDQEIQIAELAVGEKRTYIFAPTFLPRFYSNTEIKAATALVTATDPAGKLTFQGTVPVRLRAVEDMYWGPDFKYAPFIASWVTPHDRHVEQILTSAKEFMAGRRLPGYEDGKSEALQEQQTVQQAKAIYRALQQQGVSYVKSSLTLGSHHDWSERVRYPRESLKAKSANCIDGALTYASLFENLDMDPIVVLVPGHAYVGVRLTRHSQRFLYIETSLTGRSSFDVAVNAAQKTLAKMPRSQMTFIGISDARRAGIFPMPE
jgi:hypothetical protein